MAASLRAQAPPRTARAAQRPVVSPPHPTVPVAVDTGRVYTFVEQMPALPGGGDTGAIGLAIGRLLVLPARETVGGRVVLEGVVAPDGTLGRLKILRAVTPGLGSAVLAAARRLPRLTPGRHEGQAVRVRLTLPITVEVQ
jgi:protein TonB